VISLLVRESSSSFRSTADREAEDTVELDSVVWGDGRLGSVAEGAEASVSDIRGSSPGDKARGEDGGGDGMEVATEIFR
jgi:hypothetical protein